jgi:hypothetical protein
LIIEWRVGLCFFGSIALAFFLSSAFESFTAGYCVNLVFMDFCFGLFWAIYSDKVKNNQ